MKTKHTPGPLAMGTDCDSKDLVITNENTIVASVYEKNMGRYLPPRRRWPMR